jgi:CPA2 family monovalent cation:H+ antiporter-2
LILGCGRVGRYVSDAFDAMNVSYRVVDYDAAAIGRLRKAGIPVVYGDATSETVLEAAAPRDCELAVVTLPETAMIRMAVKKLKHLAPDLRVVARVHRGVDIPALHADGADAVIYAEFEAGTEMIRQGLCRLGFSDSSISGYLDELREKRYRSAPALA